MSENKDLAAYIPARETAMAVFTTAKAIDPYLAHVRAEIDAFIPDLTTKKGRDAIASMAYKVSQSKSALEQLGKSLADEAKEIPKKIDATRKAMKETLDAWRDEVRKPLDDWEAEQARIEAEKKAAEDAAALAVQIEADHEIAILLDEKYEREAAQAKEKLAAEQKARDEAIAAEAAAKATKDAEERAAQAKRDADLAIEAEKRRAAEAELEAALAKQKAEDDRVAALAKAEQDKLDAIEAERKRVAAQKAEEDAKQAELDREEKARTENKNHQRKINQAILAALTAGGMPEEGAKAFISMVARKELPELSINY